MAKQTHFLEGEIFLETQWITNNVYGLSNDSIDSCLWQIATIIMKNIRCIFSCFNEAGRVFETFTWKAGPV